MMMKDKTEFITNLNNVLSVREDYKGIRVWEDRRTGEEYMIMSLVTGDTLYFDITGCTEASILGVVCEMVCGVKPKNLITENAKRLEIGKRVNW